MSEHLFSRSRVFWQSAVMIVALTAMVTAAGQTVPVLPPTGLILGKVIDVATQAPIAGVLVELGPTPGTMPGPGSLPRLQTLTDGQGRFVFRQLPAATYTLSATTGGNGYEPSGFLITGMGHLVAPYLSGGYGQRRPGGPLRSIELPAGSVMTDAVITLWKGGSIDGTVFDEADEALVGVVVAAVRRTSDGVATTGPTTRTDDRGRYHVSALTPGDYVVVVPQTQVLLPTSAVDAAFASSPDPLLARAFNATGAPAPNQAGISIGGVVASSTASVMSNALLPPQSLDTRHVYQSTFHPGVVAPSQAKAITVRSGDELVAVDVRLTPVPARAVSGVLLDAGIPVPHFGVRLMPADTADGLEVMEVAATATDAQGRFSFPLVPRGQYRLVAQRQSLVPSGSTPQGVVTFAEPRTVSESPGAWAASDVVVGEHPGDEVVLSVQRGYRLTGRAVFRGGPRPAQERLRQLTLSAVPARAVKRQEPLVPRSQIDPSDLIDVPGISPGHYILKWPDVVPGWSVESVTLAGRDVTDAVFEITDADINDLIVTFTDQPAELTGTIRTGSTIDADVSVFMFPTDRSRWRDARSTTRVVRTVRANAAGAFRVLALPPGEYFVVALSDSQASNWPDQRFLAQLSAIATTVRVAVGQKQAVSLSTVEVR